VGSCSSVCPHVSSPELYFIQTADTKVCLENLIVFRVLLMKIKSNLINFLKIPSC
jgi:hypothetical protein